MKISSVTKKFILFGIFAALLLAVMPSSIMAGGREPIPDGMRLQGPPYSGTVTGELKQDEHGLWLVELSGTLVDAQGDTYDLNGFPIPIPSPDVFYNLTTKDIAGTNIELTARIVSAHGLTFPTAVTLEVTVGVMVLVPQGN